MMEAEEDEKSKMINEPTEPSEPDPIGIDQTELRNVEISRDNTLTRVNTNTLGRIQTFIKNTIMYMILLIIGVMIGILLVKYAFELKKY